MDAILGFVVEDRRGPLSERGVVSGRERHLHQIDLVRVLVFAAVVAVHTISRANGDASVPSGALLMALHFTREAFFALSGFVLVYAQRGTDRVRHVALLRKRVRLVLLPYLAWTLIYWADAEAITPPPGVAQALHTLGVDTGEGMASYHLYFLLVTLQIYLVFAGLLWLLRATAGHHLRLIVAATVFEAALTGWLHYRWTPGGPATGLIGHAGTLLPSYVLWVIGGGVVAMHLEAFELWIRNHGRLVLCAFVLGLGAAEASFFIEIGNGATPLHAAEVLQPVMLPWSAAAIVGLYAVGLRWAARPVRPLAVPVAQASMASFGVFLVHPLFVQLVTTHGLGPDDRVMPSGLATLVAYGLVVLGSIVLVAVILHSPLATMLTGRPRLRASRERRPGGLEAMAIGQANQPTTEPTIGPGTPGAHRRPTLFTAGRIAGALAAMVFAGSVVALGQVNDAEHKELFAANEFTPVDSLVTSGSSDSGTSDSGTGSGTPGAARSPGSSGSAGALGSSGSSGASGSAGARPATPAPPPVKTLVNLTVGGRQRSYLLVAPAGATVGLPVLIFLHGVTTTPGQELDRDGYFPLVEERQAVLVYPTGYRGSWNAGDGCCGAALTDHFDDVSFIAAVAANVTKTEHTDAKRVYLAGFSNGAKLVWKVACDAPAGFAAFVEFGGNPAPCAARGRAPFFIGVGGKDRTEPITGKIGDERGPHPAIGPELAKIVTRNGCPGSGSSTTLGTAIVRSWTGCTHGSVSYVTWSTADHHWPRPPLVPPQGSAATLTWAFLQSLGK